MNSQPLWYGRLLIQLCESHPRITIAASLRAFGVDVALVEVLAVYLSGTAVAAASPTPGNLGAVEVALSAGLNATKGPVAKLAAPVGMRL